MDLFEKMKSVGSSLTEGVLDAKKTFDTKQDIYMAEKKLKELYCAIGKKYYEEHKESCGGEYAELFSACGSTVEEIGNLKSGLNNEEGVKKCGSCGCILKEGQKFCTNCGRAVDYTENTEASINGKACKNCGKTVADNVKYCPFCGYILSEEADEACKDNEEV